ncbi:hypothetical protein M9435_005728 [Picochlorum sp. BPE23]|nr:hypothetical protein M9435_005728 [Picochlorum sp. BPE23]
MTSAVNIESIQPCFDCSASKLAWVTADGKVRIFYIDSGSTRVKDITSQLAEGSIQEGHISHSIYSCVNWCPKGPYENVMVAGAVDGSVIAYDASRMAVVWRASRREGAITGMVNIHGSKSVLVMTKSSKAFVLDMKSGNELASWSAPTKFDVTKMASLPDGRILLAGSAITMVDSTTGARLGKWTGHATPVIDLTAAEQYFCSAATGDRTIAVWSARTTPAGKLCTKAAIAQTSLNHPVAQVHMARVSPSLFHVVAVTLSGDIHVCRCRASENKTKSSAIDVVEIQEWAASESGGPSVAQVSIDNADVDSLQLTIAFGTVVKPRVTRMKITAPQDGSILEIVKADETDDDILMKGTSTAGNQTSNKSAHVPLAVAEENETVVLHPPSENVEEEEDFDHVDEMSDDEDPERNLTFAERIGALKQKDQHAPASQEPEEDFTQPKADSLAVLLGQAIANEDNGLLEKCLSVRNAKTIGKTARNLQPGDATVLVKMLVQKLQAAPRRGTQLASWIRAILIHHAGYFAGTGACKEYLGNLHQIIESRLASYQSLVALSGRLDVVLSSAKFAGQYSSNGVDAPLVTVDIDDSGALEVQDAAAAIGFESDSEEDEEESEEESDEDDLMEEDD